MFNRLLQKAIYIKVRPLLWPDTQSSAIHPAQAGFVPGGNFMDQVLVLFILITRQDNLRRRSLEGGLYAAFLDLFKAFDTLDHGHMIDILQNVIVLPLQWVEVIRRLLVNNAVLCFDVRVPLCRGNAQGGALSPLLCVCYLQDLIRHIQHALAQLPALRAALPLLNPGVCPAAFDPYVVLACLLLFADDMTVLSSHPACLQLLLGIVGTWADSRGLQFSPKSVGVVLTCPPPHLGARVLDPLLLQALYVPWREDFTYLGTFIKGYLTGESAYSPTTPDLPALRHQLADLRSLFRSQDSGLCPAIPAYLHLLQQCVLARVLARSAVMPIDLTSTDATLNRALRWALGVPPTYATVLLRSELGLLPLPLLACKRALRHLGRFLRRHVFFTEYVRPLILDHAHFDLDLLANYELDLLFDGGPLGYYDKLLTEHRATLCPPAELLSTLDQYPVLIGRPRYAFWIHAAHFSEADWTARVDQLIAAEFATWTQRVIATYPEHQQPVLRTALGPVRRKQRARYLALGGDMAYIGLRFKGLTQRAPHPTVEQFPCVYCHCPGGEHGSHWLQCPGLPHRSRLALLEAQASIVEDTGWTPEAVPRLNTAYFQVSWPRQQARSTRTVLWSMSVILDEYRRALPLGERSAFYPSRVLVLRL
jgi:hypothetical protein